VLLAYKKSRVPPRGHSTNSGGRGRRIQMVRNLANDDGCCTQTNGQQKTRNDGNTVKGCQNLLYIRRLQYDTLSMAFIFPAPASQCSVTVTAQSCGNIPPAVPASFGPPTTQRNATAPIARNNYISAQSKVNLVAE